ncbi:hypothetical protein M409DRAFT_54646 [Zasmidium cellare ATCC 36951]|uniref:NADP-dependent oxidoreductase domain-containing protein n=1 Tax=Zasmidium cellare ATCC 36951 TaxID=1080233 RepID=A0A6A6CLQ4_ZASCE|nr:uncharacterized protein M409DRAFT_54646 [Zasmidium cellare ATCC 36951]KAF2166872.1 hypothetical protein M409DRAFT_54646 [Zasmidium cellare ATCC 36951]
MSSTKDDPVLASIANTKVEYRRLGNSGLRVSVPIFGAMGLGSSEWMDWVLDEDEALPLLKAAFDRGINTWDTACNYSNGLSETLIGKAIKKYSLPRDKLVLMTKCYGFVGEEPGHWTVGRDRILPQSKEYVNRGGSSRKSILASVEGSLRRLGVEFIDVLQMHRFDVNTPVEETMRALDDLVRSGKVRYIGASSMWTYQFAQMQFAAERNGWTKFVSMQNHYSLLYREEEREMNKFCRETGVGLVPWSPLARGHLARPLATQSIRKNGEKGELPEGDQEIVRRVQELAEKKGWTMSQVALAWMNKRVSSPIVGFSKTERMDEAVDGRGFVLTEEEEKYLEEPYVVRQIQGHV